MTECNAQPLLFSSLGHKKIVADFQGGDLTSDGGLPLLREVDRKIGLIDAIASYAACKIGGACRRHHRDITAIRFTLCG
jgi:hypothetical protein